MGERHRWANRRGGLHGLVALRRVLASPTLRRMVLHALDEHELRGEIARRDRLRSHERIRSALMRGVVRSALALVREVARG